MLEALDAPSEVYDKNINRNMNEIWTGKSVRWTWEGEMEDGPGAGIGDYEDERMRDAKADGLREQEFNKK